MVAVPSHPTPTPSPTPQMPTVDDAKAYMAVRLAGPADPRWRITQFYCADSIFKYESQWDPHATNPRSDAYGIPQSNPKSKIGDWAVGKAKILEDAGDVNGAWLYRAWADNPVVQVEWGLTT